MYPGYNRQFQAPQEDNTRGLLQLAHKILGEEVALYTSTCLYWRPKYIIPKPTRLYQVAKVKQFGKHYHCCAILLLILA